MNSVVILVDDNTFLFKRIRNSKCVTTHPFIFCIKDPIRILFWRLEYDWVGAIKGTNRLMSKIRSTG